MTTREEIVALANSCGIHYRSTPVGTTEMWCWDNALEAFFHATQRQAYERAAEIAEENLADEPYGHAKFRCVNIAEAIRSMKV